MTSSWKMLAGSLLLMASAVMPSCAVELKVSRDVLQRTLKQQLFSGTDGRYYLKGNAQSACYVYADDAQLSFVGERVVVLLKVHARLGKSFGSSCIGISLNTSPEVSLSPVGEGETIGFRDARLEKVVDQKELNFLLTPFLSRQLPSSMKINAADLLRKSLTGATAATGFKVTLDKLIVHSMQTQGDDLLVDVDGEISVR